MGRPQRGDTRDEINPWGAEMFRTIAAVDPKTAVEQSAYDRWMDQTVDRQQARNERVHPAAGIVPLPLWLGLFLICGVIFGYMLLFADRGEGAVTQAVLMGSVTVVITLLMLLVVFFNHPHGGGGGPAAADGDGTSTWPHRCRAQGCCCGRHASL
jgi:hypothetical protein